MQGLIWWLQVYRPQTEKYTWTWSMVLKPRATMRFVLQKSPSHSLVGDWVISWYFNVQQPRGSCPRSVVYPLPTTMWIIYCPRWFPHSRLHKNQIKWLLQVTQQEWVCKLKSVGIFCLFLLLPDHPNLERHTNISRTPFKQELNRLPV